MNQDGGGCAGQHYNVLGRCLWRRTSGVCGECVRGEEGVVHVRGRMQICGRAACLSSSHHCCRFPLACCSQVQPGVGNFFLDRCLWVLHQHPDLPRTLSKSVPCRTLAEIFRAVAPDFGAVTDSVRSSQQLSPPSPPLPHSSPISNLFRTSSATARAVDHKDGGHMKTIVQPLARRLPVLLYHSLLSCIPLAECTEAR